MNSILLLGDMSKDNTKETDICSTIYSADKIDPFEGLNLDEICVSPHQLQKTSPKEDDDKGEELFNLNPLDDIDVTGL